MQCMYVCIFMCPCMYVHVYVCMYVWATQTKLYIANATIGVFFLSMWMALKLAPKLVSQWYDTIFTLLSNVIAMIIIMSPDRWNELLEYDDTVNPQFLLHTYTYIHIHIHTYTHTYTYIYIDPFIHTYIHTYIQEPTCLHTFMHTCTHTYIHTLHKCIHVYIA